MRHLRILLKISVANNYNNMQCLHAVRQFLAKLTFQLHHTRDIGTAYIYNVYRLNKYIKQFGPIKIFKCPSIGVILRFKLSNFSVKKIPYDT